MMLLHDFYQFAIAPFQEFAFMRRALVATLALALSSAPLGVMLTLRRMSLFGEALSHAVLPGGGGGVLGFRRPVRVPRHEAARLPQGAAGVGRSQRRA